MSKKKNYNPARFTDMVAEGLYATGRRRSRERPQLVEWLRKKWKSDPASVKLADKLENCRRKHHCKSAACPECAYAAQRLITKVMRRFLKAQANEGTMVCVTIVPADGVIKPGHLKKADHERSVRRWKEKLGKAGVGWFVGATDWSLNEYAEGRYKPRWSEHFYGVTLTKSPQKLKRELKKQFPRAKRIPRPVKIVEWDGEIPALRYILKPNFWRRVATDNAERHNKKTGTTRSCRATDKQRLRSKHKRELLVHLDEIGLQSRLLMRWSQLINVKGTRPTIVLRQPQSVSANEGKMAEVDQD